MKSAHKYYIWRNIWIFIQVSVCPGLASLLTSELDHHPLRFQFPQLPEQELINSKLFSAFDEYNKELKYYNHFGALLAWNISVNISSENLHENSKLIIEKNIWNNHWCNELLKVFNDPDLGNSKYGWDLWLQRQLYLICRGPRFSSYQLSNVLTVLGSLQKLYNKKVCISSTGQCMRMEPELNHFMENTRYEGHLREAWLAWHEHVGGEMKPLYGSLVRMLNQGAKQAGFRDMGECWRAETEIDNLKGLVMDLYSDVKYLYSLLHAYVRYKLEAFYGQKFHNGLIPAHLLGNMWAQKWDSLMDILWDDESNSKSGEFSSASNLLVNKLVPKKGAKNATVIEMVKAAEQFFVSMGLPSLPDSFWKNSYFQEEEYDEKNSQADSKNCHGSAANMFGGGEGDYRMMMCAQVSDEDFITLHHEIGHIMYFMAYSKLPTIFQEGANSAFHEAVGDSITYDLLNSSPSEKKGDDGMKILFKTGLAKLPQIGFGLVMDLWRWKVFENPDRVSDWNKMWWQLNEKFVGIGRPKSASSKGYEDGLDAAGKFHVIDNIPYIRYYLASFLQLQFYEGMCRDSTPIWNGDLHDCKIRNSKQAGSLLWNMMEKGCSRPWSEILMEMTGTNRIESGPLLAYYRPLMTWLEMEISRLNITIGW